MPPMQLVVHGTIFICSGLSCDIHVQKRARFFLEALDPGGSLVKLEGHESILGQVPMLLGDLSEARPLWRTCITIHDLFSFVSMYALNTVFVDVLQEMNL